MQHSTIPRSNLPFVQESAAVPPEFEIPEAWREHLSLLGLPRGGLKAFKSLDGSWLYQKSNWPPGVKRRLHRYMHTTDLYEVTESEGPGFSKLVDLFITASGLPKTNAARQILAAKCQALVNESSTAWGKEGVIERKSCAWRKSAKFQTLWDVEVAKLKRSKASLEQTPSDLDFEDSLNMSRRNSASINRGLSEDGVSAKRTAEAERKSVEPSKRARRSSSRFSQDDAGDFIIVSPGNRRKRASVDVKIEEENPVSPSICDDPKSPIGRIHPDCEVSEEGAQKAVDVWNSLQSSPKVTEMTQPQTSRLDLHTGKEFSSPTPSEKSSSVEEIPSRRASAASPRGSIGSVAHGSEWSSIQGSEHARAVAVRTPGSESHADSNSISRRSTPQARTGANHLSSPIPPSNGQQRTPLPAQRDQSPLQSAATASRLSVIQSLEISQPWPYTLPGQPRDPMERPWRDEAQAAGTPQEVPTSSWSVSDSTHEPQNLQSHRARWEHGNRAVAPSSPQLDRLPNTSGSPAAYDIASMVPSNIPSRDPGPFMTFPSSFSVLTTESVQQINQAKPGKRRGRKPANHNIERPKSDPPIVPQPGVDKPASFVPEDRLPRQSPVTSLTQQASLPAQSGLPAIPVSHGFYQTKLPPRPTITPPPGPPAYPSETYRPPAVVFTVDNGAKCDLLTAEFQSFVDKFKHNARAILAGFNSPNNVHEIDVIMFESLPGFYKWYSDNTGITEIGALRFELIDVNWQQERSFVVPDGNFHYFRTLKQYIWDLYWVATDMNKALGLFRVTISQFPPRSDGEDASVPGWKAVNSNKIPAKFTSPPISQSILVVPTSVPKKFRTQAQTSPPSHAMSIPPPPPPPRLTHHAPNSNVESSDQASAYHIAQSAPPNLPAKLQSPNLPLYQHGPPGPHSIQSFPPPRQNETEIRNAGQASQQSQSLYSLVDKRRTAWDQSLLREYAHSLKLRDAELMYEESTAKDKLPYKTGAEVCAVVVDRMSGDGLVTVSGKGYVTLNIPTGPNETGERFKEVTIQPKQTCMLHGGAVVLYFKRAFGPPPPPPPRTTLPTTETDERYARGGRPPGSVYDQGMNHAAAYRDDHPPLPPPPPLALPSQHHQSQQLPRREDSQTSASNSNIDIIIRVQVDGTGKFSTPFDKSVLRPKVTTTEFFSWFASQSRHTPPQPPHHLKFTFKDAMPTPQATEITAGNEDHFNYMRKDIKVQCEKAKKFMPELKEFVILVTVPGWVSPDVEEEEDW